LQRARWPFALLVLLLAAAGLWMLLRPPAVHPDSARYLERRPGLPLGADFTSYSAVADAIEVLHAKQFEALRRTLARPPDPRYPPHVLDTLTVEHYPVLGTQGRLSLQFFNDRLLEVGYRPDDAAACLQALRRAEPLLARDRNGRAERVAGDGRLATNVEMASNSVGLSLAAEPYVLWQDLRLIRQRDDWDRRFAALPDKTP
jgi:hypothetical protein